MTPASTQTARLAATAMHSTTVRDTPLGIISALDVAGVLARDVSAAARASEDAPCLPKA